MLYLWTFSTRKKGLYSYRNCTLKGARWRKWKRSKRKWWKQLERKQEKINCLPYYFQDDQNAFNIWGGAVCGNAINGSWRSVLIYWSFHQWKAIKCKIYFFNEMVISLIYFDFLFQLARGSNKMVHFEFLDGNSTFFVVSWVVFLIRKVISNWTSYQVILFRPEELIKYCQVHLLVWHFIVTGWTHKCCS